MELLIQEFAPMLALNAIIALGAALALWLISIPLRDASIIDMFFAVILMLMTFASYLAGDGFGSRKNLVAILIGLWGIRITVHLIRRNWGHGEDARYTKLRSWVPTDHAFAWLTLRRVFLLQAVVLWLLSWPVQFSMIAALPTSLGWPAYLGAGIWTVGFLCEWVADIQLARFRADPSNKGKVLDRGLWRYSRHPNYFGELCAWWGIFLIACDNPLGVVTIAGPIVYSYLVINVTGQRTLDKKLAREKPGYREYMERTSGLVPWPPRAALQHNGQQQG